MPTSPKDQTIWIALPCKPFGYNLLNQLMWGCQDHRQGTSLMWFMWFIEDLCYLKSKALLCPGCGQGEEVVPDQTMWAAIELATQRRQMFEEDRSGANALSRGKGKKKKEATEASEAGFVSFHVLRLYHAWSIQCQTGYEKYSFVKSWRWRNWLFMHRVEHLHTSVKKSTANVSYIHMQ